MRPGDRNTSWTGAGTGGHHRLMCPAHGSNPETSAAGRITSVLDAFRDDREAMTVSELARRASLPKTTTHRLTAELIRCGLLERADGELRLGLKLFELGQLVPQQRSLGDAARPVMADLREATRHSVNLGILEGSDVVYVDILAGPDSPRLPTRVGGRWPLTPPRSARRSWRSPSAAIAAACSTQGWPGSASGRSLHRSCCARSSTGSASPASPTTPRNPGPAWSAWPARCTAQAAR